MAVQGPLARSARDLELAFDVASGPDVGEDVAWSLNVPPARCDDLASFRVAVMPPLEWLPVHDEIAAAQQRLEDGLRAAGATVGQAQPEAFGDLRAHHRLYLSILSLLTGPPNVEHRRRLAENMRSTGNEFDIASANGMEASGMDLLGWLSERERYRQSYRDFFRDWDVLLAPITIVPAFPHTDAPWPLRTVDVSGQAVPYGLQVVYPRRRHPQRPTPPRHSPWVSPPAACPSASRPSAPTSKTAPPSASPRWCRRTSTRSSHRRGTSRHGSLCGNQSPGGAFGGAYAGTTISPRRRRPVRIRLAGPLRRPPASTARGSIPCPGG